MHGLAAWLLVTSGAFHPVTDGLRKWADDLVLVEFEPPPQSPPGDTPLLPATTVSQLPPSPPAEISAGRQIVDLPAANDQEPETDTPFVAERASRVEQEQRGKYGAAPELVNPGLPGESPEPDTADTPVTALRPPEARPRVPALSIPPELMPDSPPLPSASTSPDGTSVALVNPRKEETPPPLPAGTAGRGGSCPNPPCGPQVTADVSGSTIDFLAGIETTGNITLLNAKSVTYAGFVRRVATNVFNQFIRSYRTRGWRIDPAQLGESLRVDALLAADGNQEMVFIRQSTGLRLWDEMGLDAMKKGAWDSNPPKGALAADGKIHFVFIVDHRQGILRAGIL